MTERKLTIGIARPTYGGNGGVANEAPDIGTWLMNVALKCQEDSRIDGLMHQVFCDTPISMVRNDMIGWALQSGVDVLLMVDSDQAPDMYPDGKPFFDSSFDFLYKHWERGPCMIVAPYCGPPPHPTRGGEENVYVFRWANAETETDSPHLRLEAFSRTEASAKAGIEECGAGPTGLCMIDMRLFTQKIITEPYFDYEWEDDGPQCPHCHQPTPGPRRQKASTEDVFFFRNLSLNALEKLGYNPLYCNWDSWAGHWKPKCVGKPTGLKADQVHAQLRKAVLENQSAHVKTKVFTPSNRMKELMAKRPAVAVNGHATNGHVEHKPESSPIPDFQWGATMNEADLNSIKRFMTMPAKEKYLHDKKFVLVELGTHVGHTARALADHLAHFCGYEVHSVDTFLPSERMKNVPNPPDKYEEFKRNAGPRLDVTIFPHRNTTDDAAKVWPKDKLIDFLFIDASHEYEQVKRDILNWGKFVRPGGIICGHDYSHFYPGVKRAVHEVFGWDRISIEQTVWAVVKEGEKDVWRKEATGPCGGIASSQEEGNREGAGEARRVSSEQTPARLVGQHS